VVARVGSTAWVAALVSSGEWEGGGWRPLDFRCTAEIFTVYVATLLGLDLMRESYIEISLLAKPKVRRKRYPSPVLLPILPPDFGLRQ